jgi:ribose 5-phosphate isomerase B
MGETYFANSHLPCSNFAAPRFIHPLLASPLARLFAHRLERQRQCKLAQSSSAWQAMLRIKHHMKIAIGSDHAGFQYKEKIREFLAGRGHSVTDFGTHSEEPVDYPLFIRPVAEAVARGEFDRGIVLGGSGNGEAITANRVKGIRCALCWNEDSARLGRQHNDANVLSLGQRMMPIETALQLVQIWLETPFDGGRHQHRIELIDAPAT